MRPRILFALLFAVSFLAPSFAVVAQDIDRAYLRLNLQSTILLSGEEGGGDGGEDPDGEGPPDGGSNNGPLSTLNPFGSQVTVGDAVNSPVVYGGTPPYGVTLTGDLPNGINFADNLIDGYYLSPGLYTFQFDATDSATPVGNVSTGWITVEVVDQLQIANYADLVYQATVGELWALPAPAVVGGSVPYQYSADLAGADVDAATGQISVTPADVGVLGPFSLTVGDASLRSAATSPITVNVSEPLSLDYLDDEQLWRVDAAASLPAPTVAGGRGAMQFALATGTLPDGVSLAADGSVDGVPLAAATDPVSATIVVSDDDLRQASDTISWRVMPAAAVTGLQSSYSAVIGSPIALIQPTLEGAVGEVSWALGSAALPDGLAIDGTSGAITGTPVEGALSQSGIELVATDQLGSTTSAPFDVIIGDTMALAYLGSPYSFRVGVPVAVGAPNVAGGVEGARTFAVTVGSLPVGVTLNPATGEIAGTPAAVADVTSTTITASDTASHTADSEIIWSVVGVSSVSGVPTSTVATIGAPISSIEPTLNNAVGDVSWDLTSGTLPDGLSLDPVTGTISGTPEATATTQSGLRLTATDSLGTTLSSSFTISVASELSFAYSGTPYTGRVGGSAALPTVAVSGGVAPYSFTVVGGALPQGVTISGADGSVSGSPSAAATGSVSIQVVDGGGRTASADFSWTVLSTLSVTGVSASYSGMVSSAFTDIVPSATGTSGATTWSIATGTLPTGLSINPATGRISGTPTGSAGTFSGLSIRVQDATGVYQSGTFSITVAAAEHIATVSSNVKNIVLPGVYFTTAQWTSTTPKRLIIASSATVYGDAPATPALNTGTGRGGNLIIENRGDIYGASGVGADFVSGTAGVTGGNGGTAVKITQTNVTIQNYGTIGGGGGGGGSGGKGGDGFNSGSTPASYSTAAYNSSTHYCKDAGASVSPRYTIKYNSVLVYQSNSIWSGTQQSSVDNYWFGCGTSKGSGYYAVSRSTTATTAGTLVAGGNPGDGGRGQGFGVAKASGVNGIAATNGGDGGKGGAGGDYGVAGSAGTAGTDGNHPMTSFAYAFGNGGNAGYAIEASVAYTYPSLGGVKKGL